MSLFLDTSGIVKLFVQERETSLIAVAVEQEPEIYMGWLAPLEFRSAIYKKVRVLAIKDDQMQDCVERFSKFSKTVRIVAFHDRIYQRAMNLMTQFGPKGLRTLDALQISTAQDISDASFVTADREQSEIARQAGLQIKLF